MLLFSLTEYRPQREGYQTVLNPIEAEIIVIMWREKNATARTVQSLLNAKKRTMKRSAVNAAMKSLCERGLLSYKISRGKGGLKYVYRIKVSRRRFEKEIVGRLLDSLLSSYAKTARKMMRERLGG
jgi:predicted transcriptional regulator